jgi:hypothetical protein
VLTRVFLVFARLVPQLLSRFSQHGEAPASGARPIEHGRTVYFDRAHADAKLERNDFARPACNQRVNDLTLPPAEGCARLFRHRPIEPDNSEFWSAFLLYSSIGGLYLVRRHRLREPMIRSRLL